MTSLGAAAEAGYDLTVEVTCAQRPLELGCQRGKDLRGETGEGKAIRSAFVNNRFGAATKMMEAR